jgi:hypothetical protein
MRPISSIPIFSLTILSISQPSIAAPVEDNDLYSARAFVTGTREETRQPAIEDTFRQVLVKATGTPQILQSEQLAAAIDNPADYIDSYSYHDRMEGIPHHDEQGSRDRPYDLTVHFKPARVDAIISRLGFHKWALPRPTIIPLVDVKFQSNSFFLASDAKEGIGQRGALLEEASKKGLEVRLPDSATLAAANAQSQDMTKPSAAPFNQLLTTGGEASLLRGTLLWDDKSFEWKSQWQISVDGQIQRWQTASTTFDAAFRSGLGGAAQALSKQH